MPDVNENVTANEPVAEPSSILDVLNAQFPNAPDDPTVPEPVESEPVAEADSEADAEPDGEARPEGEPGGEGEKPADPVAEKPAEPAQASEADKEIADLGIKSERSKARFKELYERASKTSELESRLAEQEKVWETMESMQITPDQFSQAIGVIGFINSQDPAKLEMAYEVLSKEIELLGRKLGKAAPGYDPVQDDPDLASKVKRGELDPQDARELAELRRKNALVAERSQASLAQQAQAVEAEACRQSLNQLEVQLRQTDPQYDAKVKVLMPLLQTQMASVPFADRPATFLRAYQSLQLPATVAPSAPPPVVRPDPANTARPKSGAGGPVPTSTLEAVEMAIRGSRRDY